MDIIPTMPIYLLVTLSLLHSWNNMAKYNKDASVTLDSCAMP